WFTLNNLTAGNGNQLLKAVEVLGEMKEAGVSPNAVTYSILIVACEKKDEAELGFQLFSQAKSDGVRPNLIMCRCLTGLCQRRFEKAYSLGEPVLSFNSGKPQIDSKWTSWAITTYRETIAAGVIPPAEVFSQVLGCLQFPREASLRNKFVESLGHTLDYPRQSKAVSLLDGFGEYDSRSFSILEEASSLDVVPCVSFKEGPIVIDARKLHLHTLEVCILTVLKGLRHRIAAGLCPLPFDAGQSRGQRKKRKNSRSLTGEGIEGGGVDFAPSLSQGPPWGGASSQSSFLSIAENKTVQFIYQ
ncbi:hypothetical protein Taro_011369, partial [Colocasia esculenta]|nr:hypothetical protein [Colocasia esculenta]